MEFNKFNELVRNQFSKMCATGSLFRGSVTGDKVWELYLSSFKPENNKVFRDPNSSEHNCNCCKNFIRRYGNIVSVNGEGKLESIFSNIGNVGEYTDSAVACDTLLVNSTIGEVFFETFEMLNKLPYEKTTKSQPNFQLGTAKSHKLYTAEEVSKFGVVNTKDVYVFNHFNVSLPATFVDKTGKSVESIMGSYRDKCNVFKRAMDEIHIDTLLLVRDLIKQGSLLDGNAHLPVLETIITEKRKYDECKTDKTNYCWKTTYKMSEGTAKFKNHLIGALCSELSEGKELNKACEDWNKRVDPVNYNKAKAPITKAQIDLAKKFVVENGYEESFTRRLATLEDIKASEILHINRGDKPKEVTIFDSIKTQTSRHKRSEFDTVAEVSIENFMKEILPTCSSVELFLEDRMDGNLVNLTTSPNESKKIFKWNNPFSYTFNGNLAGKSQIKENVKSAGGKVDGVLRFSIQWNEDGKSIVDFDAHAIEPNRTLIAYDTPYRKDKGGIRTSMSGQLDVDMVCPKNTGVENITWIDKSKMKDGDYLLRVHNFGNKRNTGFKAEVEYAGETYNYEYVGNATDIINIATVTLKDGKFTIVHHMKESTSSKELWSLETNNFHKVNLMCLTPNHWGDDAIGNKHYLFMLEGCKNKDKVRGFHNEHLIPELLQHRKVLDVLGDSALIEPTDKQLAGVGFNATVRDEVILRLGGTFKRIVKVKF